MQLTPEDRARIRREFVETPTSRFVELSPEEERAMEQAIELEEAGKAETIARCLRLEELLREDSIFGALRRGIENSELSYEAISSTSGMTIERLRDFFWGDAPDLTGQELDRLAKALRLHLVPDQANPILSPAAEARMPQAV